MRIEKATKAAAISINISPKQPVHLFRQQESTLEFGSSLEANILIIEQNANKPICLVTIDALFIGNDFRGVLLGKLDGIWTYPADNILLIASHSHNAPILDGSKPKLCLLNIDYLLFVAHAVAAGIKLAKSKLENVTLEYGVKDSDLSSYRRRWSWGLSKGLPIRKIKTLPNLAGPKDSALRVWKLVNESNEVVVVLWNFSCHPVSWPNKHEISADYIGIVRDQVRASLGAAPILFLPAFMGDVRPPFYGKPSFFKDPIEWLLSYPIFQSPTISQYNDWCMRISSVALEALNETKVIPWQRISIAQKKIPLSLLFQKPVNDYLDIGIISGFNEQLWCYASAEVLSDYLPMLAKEFNVPYESIIPLAYVNEVFGYLPTDKQIKEGGYEAKDFLPWFGIKDNSFKPNIEKVIMNAWAALIDENLLKQNQ
jgi:hypothetical protein